MQKQEAADTGRAGGQGGNRADPQGLGTNVTALILAGVRWSHKQAHQDGLDLTWDPQALPLAVGWETDCSTGDRSGGTLKEAASRVQVGRDGVEAEQERCLDSGYDFKIPDKDSLAIS